jgi:hypothetical protein
MTYICVLYSGYFVHVCYRNNHFEPFIVYAESLSSN